MKVAIIDDSPEMLFQTKMKFEAKIQFLKNEIGEDVEVLIYQDPLKLISDHHALCFDVALIDIGMPIMNGIKVSQALSETNPIIFVAYITSFDAYVFDALRTPRFFKFIRKGDQIDFDLFIKDLAKQYKLSSIKYTLVNRDEIVNIPLTKITYFESRRNNLYVHTINNDYQQPKRIKDVERELDGKGFFRINSGTIINIEFIDNISNDGVTINGDLLPVSRGKVKPLREAVMKLLSKKEK